MENEAADISTEQAIQQVLQAEQAANAALQRTREEAAALLADAHRQAQRIDERARNRIARLDQQCSIIIAADAERFATQTRYELEKSGLQISPQRVSAAVASLVDTLGQ